MTDHGGSSLLSYFNRDTELWKRRVQNTVAKQRQNMCTPTVIQSLAEHVQLPDFFVLIEDFTEEDSRSESMAVTGRSPKHLRTESEDNGLDVGALMEKATDRFSSCMDAKIESIWERMDKRIDDKVDSKLGPVMDKLSASDSKLGSVVDRLSALEKTSTRSTRSGPSSSSDGSAGSTTGPMIFAPSFLEIKGWCSCKDRNTLGLSEGQAREFVEKLRQGIGSELDSMTAHAGAMRVKNTKIICYSRNPSSSNCKQIGEAMCAYIERENIRLGGATPHVIEEKPVWRQEQHKTFGKALGVAEHFAKNQGKHISSEWYPFCQVYVHDSESSQPIPLLSTASGAPVVNAQGAEMLGTTVDKLVMACRRGTL